MIISPIDEDVPGPRTRIGSASDRTSPAGVGRMRFRTWPVVAVALLGLLALIVVSILAAQRKADAAYAHLDSLNARYRDVETRLRRVRSGLHLSGILARDYLLDTTTPASEYRSRLVAYHLESEADDSPSSSRCCAKPIRDSIRELRRQLDEYWRAYAPLFDGTTQIDRYGFLRREIVPRRDAVMRISAEIEAINNRTLARAAAGSGRPPARAASVPHAHARRRASRWGWRWPSSPSSASACSKAAPRNSTAARSRPNRSCGGSRTSWCGRRRRSERAFRASCTTRSARC